MARIAGSAHTWCLLRIHTGRASRCASSTHEPPNSNVQLRPSEPRKLSLAILSCVHQARQTTSKPEKLSQWSGNPFNPNTAQLTTLGAACGAHQQSLQEHTRRPPAPPQQWATTQQVTLDMPADSSGDLREVTAYRPPQIDQVPAGGCNRGGVQPNTWRTWRNARTTNRFLKSCVSAITAACSAKNPGKRC